MNHHRLKEDAECEVEIKRGRTHTAPSLRTSSHSSNIDNRPEYYSVWRPLSVVDHDFCLSEPDSAVREAVRAKILSMKSPLKVNSYYLDKVRRGLVDHIKAIFAVYKEIPCCGLKKDCVDQNEMSAFRLAVECRNVKMCRVLLKEKVSIKDCLFHAIQRNYADVVEVILKYHDSINIKISGHNSHFQPGLTPVLMAAGQNNYDILNLLLEHGHDDLENNSLYGDNEDFDCCAWEAVNKRRLVLKARSSPSYITTICERYDIEPFRYCIQLVRQVRENAAVEYEYGQFYKNLQFQIEDFLCSLLNQIRSTTELSQLFKYSLKSEQGLTNIGPRRHQVSLECLKTAVKENLKKVVTHRNSQLALTHMKYRNTSNINEETTSYRFLWSFIGFFFPILSLFYIIAPNSKPGKILTRPVMAFYCIRASECIFVVLIILHVWTRKCDNVEISGLVVWIFIWVVGILVQEIQESVNSGIRTYLSNFWNYVDFGGAVIYLIASAIAMNRKNCLCTDHVDIETGLFALAYILFLLKILGFETNNQYFGPILVSMGRMLKDIAKFTGVLLWVIIAYSVAFTKIFSCCTTMDGTLHRKPCNVTCFKSIMFSFATFTDTIFSQEVNINSLIVNLSPTSHSFAKYLLLSFRVVVILVMWNMLIAIMTKSYERTSENEELEWKFHRTQLWIHYIHREVVRPPPMNLIPHPHWIWKCLQRLLRKTSVVKTNRVGQSLGFTVITLEQRRHAIARDRNWVKDINHILLQRASVQVMRKLIWRYKNRNLIWKSENLTTHEIDTLMT